MDKKTVVITGANTVIGFATAKLIAAQGHKVILACRNPARAEHAMQRLRSEVRGAELEFRELDLSAFDSIRRFSAALLRDYPAIDVLINNAGVYPRKQRFTREGFEMQFGVNYLGHFLLTHRLLPAIERSGEGRIIHLSSIIHNLGRIRFGTFRGRRPYFGIPAYGQSKLANLMFSNELAKRLPGEVTSNAVHPGAVDSEIYRELPTAVYRVLRLTLISPDRAGRYIADMALSPEWKGRTGEFRSAHGPLPVARRSRDAALSRRLYEESCELTGVEPV